SLLYYPSPGATHIYPLSLHDALPISALKKDTWMDTSAIAASVAGISMPSFFAGLVIAYIFGYLLHSITGLNMTGSLWEYDPFTRSEEHTSELQSRENLVCRLLLEKKK